MGKHLHVYVVCIVCKSRLFAFVREGEEHSGVCGRCIEDEPEDHHTPDEGD